MGVFGCSCAATSIPQLCVIDLEVNQSGNCHEMGNLVGLWRFCGFTGTAMSLILPNTLCEIKSSRR